VDVEANPLDHARVIDVCKSDGDPFGPGVDAPESFMMYAEILETSPSTSVLGDDLLTPQVPAMSMRDGFRYISLASLPLFLSQAESLD
jgi:hypothetical protein